MAVYEVWDEKGSWVMDAPLKVVCDYLGLRREARDRILRAGSDRVDLHNCRGRGVHYVCLKSRSIYESLDGGSQSRIFSHFLNMARNEGTGERVLAMIDACPSDEMRDFLRNMDF